jgi:non-ribosomal peptide synthetase component F
VCGGESLSFGELEARSNRVAAALAARGAGTEVRVGVYLDRSHDLVVALLGVIKAGAAYVPLDAGLPRERLAYMLADSGARLVVTRSDVAEGLPRDGHEIVRVDALPDAREPAARVSVEVAPSSLAYAIYTSGSTGVPKGVMVEHRAATQLIEWVNSKFTVGPGDRLLFVTSPGFDLSVYDVFGILGAGACIHIATDDDLREPDRLLRLLVNEGITFWDSAPARCDS